MLPVLKLFPFLLFPFLYCQKKMTGIRNETSRIQQIYWEIPKPYLESFQTFKPLSVNPTKWSTTLKQLVGKLQANCLSVFDHFVGLALKGLR